MARNRGRVLSSYRQVMRCLNNPDLPLSWGLQMKAEVRGIILLGAKHDIEDLLDTADYAISLLRSGKIPKSPM
uniref:LYR motif containing domain-containing protein n=1 Tax=Kalanchoe fedtschenkoi TaxID=63787 RepID=A0A7N0ZZU0_KALFE